MFAHLTEILHQFYGELTYSGPERSVRTGDRWSGVCPAAVVQERTREPDVCCASMVRLSAVEMLTCPTGTTSRGRRRTASHLSCAACSLEKSEITSPGS